MNFQLINFPMKYGCHVDGADEGFYTLESSKWLEQNHINVTHIPIIQSSSLSIPYDTTIMNAAQHHRSVVFDMLNHGLFPCSWGGDHTCGLGGPSGALKKYDHDLTIIWLDAHADSHTSVTSPSMHIHGMPCAILQNLDSSVLSLPSPHLASERLMYVGLNSYENEEIDYIASKNIPVLKAENIRNQSIEDTLHWIHSNIKTKYVYLSFDFDVLAQDEFYAVNVNSDQTYSNPLGLTLQSVHTIITMLFQKFNVVGCDVVEYNPRLDPNLTDFSKVIQTLNLINSLVKENPCVSKPI